MVAVQIKIPHLHQYPVWFNQARQAFERVYQDYLLDLIKDTNLAPAIVDSTNPGRRVRPALYYALWKAGTDCYPAWEDSLPAIALELFHTASIIVDDIADQELIRRDKFPLHRLYGIDTAALVSHYLIAKGYEALLQHPEGRALSAAWTRCYASSAKGEALDLKRCPELSLSDQQQRSLKKTSAIFSFIARSLNVCRKEESTGLVIALEGLGKCFQISNDVIDLAYFESSGRYDSTSNYLLSLSYLIPALVDAGQVVEPEVFTSLSYDRFAQISRASAALIPGGITTFLEQLFRPMCETIQQANILSREEDLILDFIHETTKASFWLHHHV